MFNEKTTCFNILISHFKFSIYSVPDPAINRNVYKAHQFLSAAFIYCCFVPYLIRTELFLIKTIIFHISAIIYALNHKPV
jgi:hypothetical protein